MSRVPPTLSCDRALAWVCAKWNDSSQASLYCHSLKREGLELKREDCFELLEFRTASQTLPLMNKTSRLAFR